MKGQFIKYLRLCPDLSYDDLEIKEGGIKVLENAITSSGDVQLTRTHLLKYCRLDTWAMVKILDKINEVI